MSNKIYIPKHNDFNSDGRLEDEHNYFSENPDKDYHDYMVKLTNSIRELQEMI